MRHMNLQSKDNGPGNIIGFGLSNNPQVNSLLGIILISKLWWKWEGDLNSHMSVIQFFNSKGTEELIVHYSNIRI